MKDETPTSKLDGNWEFGDDELTIHNVDTNGLKIGRFDDELCIFCDDAVLTHSHSSDVGTIDIAETTWSLESAEIQGDRLIVIRRLTNPLWVFASQPVRKEIYRATADGLELESTTEGHIERVFEDRYVWDR